MSPAPNPEPSRAVVSLEMAAQPDDTTCGPTCLHALYRFLGDDIALGQVVKEVEILEGGGTLAVFLGCHALRRGYRATLYVYNLDLFDPTWFSPEVEDLARRLRDQARHKRRSKLQLATRGFIEFLDRGGRLRFEDLTASLLRRFLRRGVPILTGLSCTFLYRSAREYGPADEPDDVRGEPAGHFVVLCGYDREARTVLVADPLRPNPVAEGARYAVSLDRVCNSILLGVFTHDANLLILEPARSGRGASRG